MHAHMKKKSPTPCGLLAALFLGAAALFSSCATPPAPPAAADAAGSIDLARVAEEFSRAGIPLYKTTSLELHFTPDSWKARALELIRGAKDYILIDSYLTGYHPVVDDLFQALAEKASQGVKVYITFDSTSYFTYFPGKTDYFPAPQVYFAGTSVHIAEYNPLSGVNIFALPRLLDRDHRKYWIIDGEYFAAGGMNLYYYSFAPSSGPHNLDTVAITSGAELTAAMVKSFCATWNEYSTERIDPDDFGTVDADAGSSSWLVDQDLRGSSEVDAVFRAFFEGARREIWMIQAYAFVSGHLVKQVEEAVARGVSVNVILSNNAIRTVYDKAAKYRALDLMDSGASVYMFDPPDRSFIHYKLMLADGSLAAFGSANYNLRSQYLSREIGLVTADSAVIREAEKNLEDVMADCVPVTRQEALSYRGIEYWTAFLSMLYGG